MDIGKAVTAVLEGASMSQVAEDYRQHLIKDFGFRPDETRQVLEDLFRDLACVAADAHGV